MISSVRSFAIAVVILSVTSSFGAAQAPAGLHDKTRPTSGQPADLKSKTRPASAVATSNGTTKSWVPPRTPDGQPDLQGYWTSATYTPFERPDEFKDKPFFTEQEAAAYAKRRLDQLNAQPRDAIHYDDALWQSERKERGVTSLRTSIVVDPPDGKIPAMTAEGQKRAAERAAARKLIGPADSVQTRALSERCII